MTGVIYPKDWPTDHEEIIFPEAQGVTPDIDTKQAKKIFFQIRLSRDGKIPQNQFLTPKNKKSKVFHQCWIFETKNKDLRGSAASEEKTQKTYSRGVFFFRVMLNRNFELFEHLKL